MKGVKESLQFLLVTKKLMLEPVLGAERLEVRSFATFIGANWSFSYESIRTNTTRMSDNK